MGHATLATTRLRTVLQGPRGCSLCSAAPFALAPAAGAVIPPAGEDEGQEPPAAAVVLPPDRTGAVTPAAPLPWAGAVASGRNRTFDPGAPVCSKTPETYCDITLVDVQSRATSTTRAAGGVEFSTGGAAPGTDIDLYVYTSDAAGTVGEFVGASGGATDPRARVRLDASRLLPRRRRLLHGRRTRATPAGPSSSGATSFRPTSTARRASSDSLVSDPRPRLPLALRAASLAGPDEPADPRRRLEDVQPRPDSLAEYEFKIGTYASFDRGRRWFDLGQLNTCPISQAPPSSLAAEEPLLPGRRPEPRRHRARRTRTTAAARATSGRSTRPPTSGRTSTTRATRTRWCSTRRRLRRQQRNGCGMSFHRWETPSLQDIRSGRTWSSRIPINAYTDAASPGLDARRQEHVRRQQRRAGPRRQDRHHRRLLGPELRPDRVGAPADRVRALHRRRAQLARPAEGRSRRRTPAAPVRAPRHRRHVVADERDPNTFYAVWLDTLTGFLDGTGTSPLWFTKTTDGARTWEPARIIARISSCRTSSRARASGTCRCRSWRRAAAAGCTSPTPTTTRAPDPSTDEDGLQADIKIMRSSDGGDTGRRRRRSTRTRQRRPVPAVRPGDAARPGQRVVLRPSPRRARSRRTIPGNFFIDTFLSRSNDGGAHVTDTRVSHDSWDPVDQPADLARRASSSATTRGSWPTTASRSRSSTTRTWRTTRAATRPSTAASRARRSRRS